MSTPINKTRGEFEFTLNGTTYHGAPTMAVLAKIDTKLFKDTDKSWLDITLECQDHTSHQPPLHVVIAVVKTIIEEQDLDAEFIDKMSGNAGMQEIFLAYSIFMGAFFSVGQPEKPESPQQQLV